MPTPHRTAPSELYYRRTAARPAFCDLPHAVRERLAALAGGVVAVADPPVTSGFTGAYAGRLVLKDGRAVFAPTISAPTPPHCWPSRASPSWA